MERFGFRMGPFRRMDAVGVDRAVRGLRQLAGIVGERMAPAAVVERLPAEGGTFYRYRKGRAVEPAPGLPAAATARPAEHEALIRERLLLLLVNEAALAEGEGVAEAGAIDLASIAGLGFPRSRGGVLHHARQDDPAALMERFARLEERFGARFAPAPALRREAGATPAGHARTGVL
jgi:3-hydroxyacyl-CoA dehydrogenase